jgi:hypothetical protein
MEMVFEFFKKFCCPCFAVGNDLKRDFNMRNAGVCLCRFRFEGALHGNLQKNGASGLRLRGKAGILKGETKEGEWE